MCRGFQQQEHHHHHHHERLLNIKAFYLRLSVNPKTPNPQPLPDSLTLCYLPRINGSRLEINNSKIRPHSPAFVTLHRLLSPPTSVGSNINVNKGGSVYFGSRERVKAGQGSRFEVYLREHKVLKGIFRKDWDDRWKMGCSCGLDDDDDDGDGVLQLVKEAEVCVVAQGHDAAMREKVEMAVKRRRRRRRTSASCAVLEEIPEETEFELDDGSCCCCSCSDDDEEEMGSSSHFHDEEEEEGERDMGASWAVDVGIWVMCLGVGFLVSSNAFLRRRKARTPFF